MNRLEVIKELERIVENLERTRYEPEEWDHKAKGWNEGTGFAIFEINELLERI